MRGYSQPHIHYKTYLIRGGHGSRLSAPDGSTWDLLLAAAVGHRGRDFDMFCFDKTTRETPFITVHFSTGSEVQHPALTLHPDFPFVFEISDSRELVQLVFGSSSNLKPLIEYDDTPISPTPPTPEFFEGLRKLSHCDDSLMRLNEYVGHNPLLRTSFFDMPDLALPQMIDAAIRLFMRRNAAHLPYQLFQLITIIATNISEGKRLEQIDARILLIAVDVFPELLNLCQIIVINSQTPLDLLAVLTFAPHFSVDIFRLAIDITGRENPDALWSIFCFVVNEGIPISGRFVSLFERMIPQRRLRQLLRNNVVTDGICEPAEIVPKQFVRLEVFGHIAVHRPAFQGQLRLVADRNWAWSTAGSVQLAPPMVYDVDLVRRGPLRVEEMVSQNLVMPGRRRFVDPDHCELFFIEVLCILGCFLAWLWCPPGFR